MSTTTIALVTGASRGVGREAARALVQRHGVNVLAVSRDGAALRVVGRKTGAVAGKHRAGRQAAFVTHDGHVVGRVHPHQHGSHRGHAAPCTFTCSAYRLWLAAMKRRLR